MTPRLSERLLSELSEFVAGEMGLHFPPERWRDLERGIQSAAREWGVPDIESCAQWLLSAPLTRDQIGVLADELTVGETYFFRERRSLEVLGEQILPELIRARQGAEQRLRIWSAGCCTGEEPYSIAILLDRVLPDLCQWQVTILGTDVNPRFLKKAATGIFGEWSFRDAPAWLKEGYFRPLNERRFELLPQIKARVTFAYLNLAEDVCPSLANNTNAMDVIFCRNVLMYFAADRAGKVIQNFHRVLVDGGWLVVSPTETSHQLFSPFASVPFDGATLYRKGNKQGPTMISFSQETRIVPLSEGAAIASPPVSPFVFIPEPPTFVISSESVAEPVSPDLDETPVREAQPTHYEEALALFEQGDCVEVAQKLKADLAHTQEKAGCLALLARTCANLGELGEARQWVEKAVAADKLNAGLHYLRAIILQEQGATDEAVASLKRALYLDADFVLAHFALGNLALRHKKAKEADKHFANALALLERYRDDEVLPQSDGLAAGRLREMIRPPDPRRELHDQRSEDWNQRTDLAH